MPLSLSLSLVALFGYVAGRLQRRPTQSAAPHAKRAFYRAHSVVRELEDIVGNIRESLDEHRSSLTIFRNRLKTISSSKNRQWEGLAVEAENLLKPTLCLSSQIAHSYDSIRQQTQLLMYLTEVRTDPLTGLRNRRALDEAMQANLAMMERYGNVFSVAVFDVDHFKSVNDEKGHLEGDRVLQDVAAAIDAAIRDTDIAARFGGEEFVIVMPETDLDGASVLTERTRAAISDRLSVTVSGGVTEAKRGDDASSILRQADEAMYEAKSGGRNCVYQNSDDGPQRVVCNPAAWLAAADAS